MQIPSPSNNGEEQNARKKKRRIQSDEDNMVKAIKEVTIILAAQLKDASDNLSKAVIGVVAAENVFLSMLDVEKEEWVKGLINGEEWLTKVTKVMNFPEEWLTKVQVLELVLKATNEKYESMLNDAKHEIDVLMNTIQQSKNKIRNSKAEWEQKELHLVNCV
nr:web family protein, chloroplastic [Quercus suber]